MQARFLPFCFLPPYSLPSLKRGGLFSLNEAFFNTGFSAEFFPEWGLRGGNKALSLSPFFSVRFLTTFIT
jgi:hypothetical protein